MKTKRGKKAKLVSIYYGIHDSHCMTCFVEEIESLLYYWNFVLRRTDFIGMLSLTPNNREWAKNTEGLTVLNSRAEVWYPGPGSRYNHFYKKENGPGYWRRELHGIGTDVIKNVFF